MANEGPILAAWVFVNRFLSGFRNSSPWSAVLAPWHPFGVLYGNGNGEELMLVHTTDVGAAESDSDLNMVVTVAYSSWTRRGCAWLRVVAYVKA